MNSELHRDEILCIIPARGGSKGIPRKNVIALGGKPLLAYSIDHARATPAITRIVVSTDDKEIAAMAREYRAEVITRPAEISGDEASSETALEHALTLLKESEGYEPGLVVFLQATSPLRRPDDIQKAIENLRRDSADSLFSAGPVNGFVWRVDAGGLRPFSYDMHHRPRRQDAPEDLIENGSIYVFKPEVLVKTGNRLGGKIAVYRMPAQLSYQVDEPGDLELIEGLLSSNGTLAPVDLSSIQLLALDFDGVMTDNRVLTDDEGREAVWCDRGDGWGIARLKDAGLHVVVISTERNPVVGARCRKLGILCMQGCPDKLAALRDCAHELRLERWQVAYVGNDENDLTCLGWAGTPIAVADAVSSVRAAAHVVTKAAGGRGAVREVCDMLLKAKRGGTK